MIIRPPNPRVQRTRPCASLRGSPLARHPLGATGLFLVIALSLACASNREPIQAVVDGVVTDPTGTLLPGVLVTLTTESSNAIRTAMTDQTGNYCFLNLPPGRYQLSFWFPGFSVPDPREITVANGMSVDLGGAVLEAQIPNVVSTNCGSGPVVSP